MLPSSCDRHFGDEILERIGAPLLSGVFGGDVTRLSARAVMAPFVAMERDHGSLICGLRARAEFKGCLSIHHPRAVWEHSIDRMVAAIPAAWIRLGASVKFVSNSDEGWLVGTPHEVERFDAIFMAAPVEVARSLLYPVDSQLAELLQMDASSAVVVAFGFPDATRLCLPQGFGFLVPPGSGSLLLACTFVDQKFDDRVPHGGRLLRAFFGGAAADRLMRCGNDETAAVARLELARILGPMPVPQITVVRRLPRSLPQYVVGHLDRLAELNTCVSKLDGLWLLGNGYRGVGIPDLIRDSRTAAHEAAPRS